ncbi:MAG: nicotinate-nucleotide--dimethylbenzimidazole phosphoribosyltransferase [Ruminococcus sp.]|nr:nicotinate-nucleotide--dimethylbenzimidazole phosphoribosyltransferase [Ruminococcus sp.]
MDRIKHISPPDKAAYHAAAERWDSIAKPLGSFGALEEAVKKIAAVQGTPDVVITPRTAVVMCADHGVVAEGVTQCGSEVTAECAADIAEGRANINAIADIYGIDVIAVDIGMANDARSEKIINKKTARGTRNITRGAAMTKEQLCFAITAGMDIVKVLHESGTKLIVTGEMGIGNTTSAAAIASVLLGLPPESVTGRGAGLSSEGLRHKTAAVKRAIEINRPDRSDPAEVLRKLGGFEIAGMTGLFLGGAYYKMPVLIDGVISAAAAAIACGIEPLCTEYMLASHCSNEPAAEGLLRLCGNSPVINAGLRLGEGTGAALYVSLLDGALGLYRNARRFGETSIERYVEQK